MTSLRRFYKRVARIQIFPLFGRILLGESFDQNTPGASFEGVRVSPLQEGYRFDRARVVAFLFIIGFTVSLGLRVWPSVRPLLMPETITFEIRETSVDANAVPHFVVRGGWNTSIQSLTFRTPLGESVNAQYSVATIPGTEGDTSVDPQPLQVFHPGLYEAVLRVLDHGQLRELTQPFYWGVVAVDIRRSVAEPYKREDIEIAVLDDIGRTVCDSEVEVRVAGPHGDVQEFTTDNGGVVPNPECQDRSVTNVPDYRVPFIVGDTGRYIVSVVATTNDGPRWIKDTFTVSNNAGFDVMRTEFPSRIYPPSAYPVSFAVTPDTDFVGTIVERVPASFAIDEIGEEGKLDDSEYSNGMRKIVWNVVMQAGETYHFTYRFDAPNISPLLHRLGRIQILSTSGVEEFAESRQWQIASDATKTWDGGGLTDSWSECANWNLNTCPANTGDDILFDGTSNDPSTWDNTSTVTSVASITVSSMSGLFTITKTPVTITGNFSHTSTGNVAYTSSASISIGGDYTMTTSGTMTANSSTITMTGAGKSINSSKTIANLTIDPSSSSTISTVTSNFFVSGTLTVATNDTLSIGSGLMVTSSNAGTVTINGTISGAGTLSVQNSNLGSGGSLLSAVRLDASVLDISSPARTYGGAVEVYNSSSLTAHTVTPAAGTHTISGSLTLNASANQNVTFVAASNNPTMNISGDLDFTGVGVGTEIITSGTGTWTVSGTVDFTGGTYTATSGNTLVMNGGSKTLTTNSNTLSNLTLSSSITLASATHTISGNLDMTGATITAGTSTLVMNGTGGKTIVGGSAVLYNLTINPSSTGTITVQNTGLTILHTLDVANGDTLSISSGADVVTANTSGTSFALNTSGIITGAGRLVYLNPATSFPTTGTVDCVVRFESTATTAVTVPERTYGGDVEFYINSITVGTTTATVGTTFDAALVVNGDLRIVNDNRRALIVDMATAGPNITVNGDIDFQKNDVGTITLKLSSSMTTVSGNVDLTDGTLDASSSGEFLMTGTANLIGNGQSFGDVRINGSGNTVTVTGSDVSVDGVLTIGGAGDSNNDTLSIASGRVVTTTADATVQFEGSGTDTISGAGTLVVQHSNLDTDGTLSSQLRFDATNGDITEPARTYGGNVEIYNNSGSSARTISMAAGTHTYSGLLTLNANGSQNVVLTGATNNPTVNISSDFDLTGVGAGTENIVTGNDTWTFSGNVDLTGGTFTATSGNTIVMNGTGGKALTPAGQSFYNATFDPASTATITIQTSNLTVSNTLAVASSDTVDIASGVTVTHSGATLTLNGTISGLGTLVYQSASVFPTTGTISSALRFDASNTNQAMSARTYGGTVEVYNNSGSSARTLTMGAGTYTLSSSLNLNANGTQNITLDAATNNPTLSISGNLTYVGGGAGGEVISSGTGTWTIAGNVDFSNGIFTATAGNTILLTGTANLIANGQSLYDLTVNGNGTTVTVSTSDLTVSHTLTVGATADGNNDTLTINSGRAVTSGPAAAVVLVGSGTDSISGAGRVIIANSNLSTTGTLSTIVQFDVSAGDISMPARNYGNDVEVATASSSGHSVAMGAGTHSISGRLLLAASGSGDTLLDASANNPTVNVLSDIDYAGSGGGNEIIRTGTGTWTVSGNIDLSAGTLTAASGNTIIMNGSTASITTANQQLYSLTTSGTITANDSLTLAGDLAVSSGTFSSTSSVNVLGGDATGAGTINASAGTFTIDGTGNFGGTTTWSFANLTIGDGVGSGTTTASSTGAFAVSGVLTIGASQTFNAGSKTVILSGTGTPFVVNGTFAPSTSTFQYVGNAATLVTPATYATLQILPAANSVTHTLGAGTFTIANTLTLGDGTHVATISAEANDPVIDINGDVAIQASATFAASSTSGMQVAGNWVNSGVFTSGTGTITFDAATTGKTIEPGASPFHSVVFNNPSGGWTLQSSNVLATGDVELAAASSFTVQNGRTLEVQGNFSNEISAASTTWTGTTLYLNGSGGMYDINTKTQGGDTYAAFHVGSSEDIAMWDTTIGTLTVDTGGCVFSEDHQGIDGRMEVTGTCNTRPNEYWSYASDFDGASLGLSARQPSIRFAEGSSLTVDAGDILTIVGQSAGANHAIVTHQTSGNFGMVVDGTLDAHYFDIDYLNASGLHITSNATVNQLSNGSFDNIGAGADASYITVEGINSTKTFSNVIFDSQSDGTDPNVVHNVSANGLNITWSFDGAAGNHTGAEYDNASGGAMIVWLSALSVSDGGTMDIAFTNSNSSLSASWEITSSTNLAEYRYAIGTTPGAADIQAFTSTGLSTNVTKNGLSLVDEETYYFTIRALTAEGESITQASSDGVSIDRTAAVFSAVTASKTSASFTVIWTSSEPTTTKIKYGSTSLYGNESTEDMSLQTQHIVTISGLASGSTYHFQLIGSDHAGNITQSSDGIITTTAPENTVITNVQVSRKSSSSVIVTWETNQLSDSKVRYGLTTDYGSEMYDATLVTSHALTLTGLTPNTQYHYEVISTGNSVAIDADSTFSTPSDTELVVTPPTIVSPVADSTIRTPTLLITGNATSGSDVFIVMDSELLAVVKATTSVSGVGHFNYQMTKALSVGRHTIVTRARLNDVVSDESVAVQFGVLNPSFVTPTLLTPILRDGKNPIITLVGLARSNAFIKMFLNNKQVDLFWAGTNATGTSAFYRNLATLQPGTYTVQLQAVSASGETSAKSLPVRFVVTGQEGSTPVSIKPSATISYIVKPGDSFWRVAKLVYGNGALWQRISVANRSRFPQLLFAPSIVQPGWLLTIPPL